MKYFISDLHYGHENVLRFDHRPFEDVGKMNKAIINGINDTVNTDDELYIIGDIAMKPGLAMECLEQINCERITLVEGNHDNVDVLAKSGLLYEVIPYMRLMLSPSETGLDEKLCAILCHYPILCWDRQRYGAIHLYGHVHIQIPDYYKDGKIPTKFDLSQLPNAYNVFCGYQGYRPWTAKQILEKYGYNPQAYVL